MTDFAAFFKSVWKSDQWPKPEPFPWQTMLAERGASGRWPEAINLPTASGKTACLDAAIFALAATSSACTRQTRMPRRIWFVVDRRIVVDEAFQRAKRIAKKLHDATNGPAKEVADCLRNLAGTGHPLAVARLRGGTWRDDGWARVPSQPAIICSTVDQVGSALLFRAYGHSERTASIYAGLAAQDSLILLDEAHCAVPFLQTLQSISRFRDVSWAEHALQVPFRYSIMSATLPAVLSRDACFPNSSERSAALDHPLLDQRFTAQKPARLVVVKGDEEFVTEAASCANALTRDARHRVAVMVNRVLTAERIADRLRAEIGGRAEVVLLTGRMRPLDRDALVARWEPLLKAGSTKQPPAPIVVVTTQCLEVGADFSFDALVTECASLDALRQRFGRLNRLGQSPQSPAIILVRQRDTKEPKGEEIDPIYGAAIYQTWNWLTEVAQQGSDGTIDFGIHAMDRALNGLQRRDKEQAKLLFAPTRDAPILLPAHLDLLCQTAPRPDPEPDIALFLHGKGRWEAEARVVVRADLPDAGSAPDWIEILSLVPPTSPEMWTVPLYRLRRWLVEAKLEEQGGDVEGAFETAKDEDEVLRNTAQSPFLIWRGRDHSQLTHDVLRIRPNDIVILKAAGEALRGPWQTLQNPDGLGLGCLDLAERALREARGKIVLRIQSELLAPFLGRPSVKALVELPLAYDVEHDDIAAALQAVLDEAAAPEDGGPEIPEWLTSAITALVTDDFRFAPHPLGGLILTGKKEHRTEAEDDPFADEDDLTSKGSRPVTLRRHSVDVQVTAAKFASDCLTPEFSETFASAAAGHDLGKLDWRFQLLLQNGDELALADAEPLAKSIHLPERSRRRIEIREDVRLPKGFRHEFLSLQIVAHLGLAPSDTNARDLALHLIASHHGHARPFAPVVTDRLLEAGNIADLSLTKLGLDATLTAAERRTFPAAHRLDSGIADRFWRLTRRYGWWGLAYLEAVFRLADWSASRIGVQQHADDGSFLSSTTRRYASATLSAPNAIELQAIDGANPLGFLAAMGALRVLTRAFPGHGLRLSWNQVLGAWRPVLWSAMPLDQQSVVTALCEAGLHVDTMFSKPLLAASEAVSPTNKKGEPRWKDKLLFPVSALRDFCIQATASPCALAEFSATWAGETVLTGEEGKEVGRRTRFDFTAGQQAFIGMLRELREKCTAADLERALFTGWRYSPHAVSMRWDTQDEKRQYALQAVDPTNNSQNPPMADLGANFLAVEALPLFPLVADRWASQPGFDRNTEGRYWRWPIWVYPLSLDSVRSLLVLALSESEEWPPAQRRGLGVAAVFQSSIVQPSGRYRCFTPAISL